MKKKIVVLTGAGISAESGISTFRDNGGLWENHRMEDVATPQAWERDMDLVLRFYNKRRKELLHVEPNAAHMALADLQAAYDVHIITQNVDNLHERAGSQQVLHLHGELKKVRSTANPDLIYTLDGWELKKGDTCELGSQLRPHIVWFGEAVPAIEEAAHICAQADIALIVGTGLEVYPAAGLMHYFPDKSFPIYYVDPKADKFANNPHFKCIADKAGTALPQLAQKWLQDNMEM